MEQEFPYLFSEWLKAAEEKLDQDRFDYLIDGSGTESSFKNNAEAFDQLKMVRRVLLGVEKCDLSTKVLGVPMVSPLLLVPVGGLMIFHPEGELGVARAAKKMGVPMVLSGGSSTPLEEIGEVMGNSPHWFQAFMYQDREITTSLLRRAEAAGFSAVVLTVDNEAPGWRIRRMRGKLSRLDLTDAILKSDPVLKAKVEAGVSAWRPLRGRRSWDDFDFVRRTTKLPLLIKGISHPADASLAVEHGADGIIVSNHGGRQLDHEIATIDALPEVLGAVQKKIPVLVDGGVRQAIDAIKALALGASAVLVGRLYVSALSVGGEAGVSRMLENFMGEMRSEMQNLGCKDVAETHSIRVVTRAPIHVVK